MVVQLKAVKEPGEKVGEVAIIEYHKNVKQLSIDLYRLSLEYEFVSWELCFVLLSGA